MARKDGGVHLINRADVEKLASQAFRRRSSPTLNLMRKHAQIAALLAAVGAPILCALEFTSGLEGAGPYRNLIPVKVAFVLGMMPAYFLVLWLTAWLAGSAVRSAHSRWKIVAVAGVSVLGALAAFFAPLLPSASLAAACASQALCPEAANPMLWSYLQLIANLSAMPSLVAFVIVCIAANWQMGAREV
jgi:hypothetical protein